jgi:dihydroflavonol-4-reductase
MVIAVTGASGHVGFNLCGALVAKGFKVRALVHNHRKELSTLPVELFTGDLLDSSSLEGFLSGVDIVYHLAARISIAGDPGGVVWKTNVEGTRNILELALRHKVNRFIHFSSIHAFNQYPLNEPLDETRPLVTSDGMIYDQSKAEAERMVMAAATRGLNALVLSPTAIIGPADPEPSMAGQAVIDLYNNKIPAMVPGGYDWVDVRDVVDAAIAAIDKGQSGEKYLLAGQWHSVKELSEAVSRITGKKTIQTELPMWLAWTGLPFITLFSLMTGKRPIYTRELLKIISEGNKMIDHSKAGRALGFHPRPFENTLSDLLKHFKDSGKIQ